MARVRLLYFAWLRDRIGRAEEDTQLPPEVTDVATLLGWLRGREPALAALAGEGRAIRIAVNQEFARPDTAVADGDEVALFPPVTGG